MKTVSLYVKKLSDDEYKVTKVVDALEPSPGDILSKRDLAIYVQKPRFKVTVT